MKFEWKDEKQRQTLNEFDKSEARGILRRVFQKHYIELNKEQETKLHYLASKLNYDKDTLKHVAEFMELVADSNYRLGAERQKDALLYNIKNYIDDL